MIVPSFPWGLSPTEVDYLVDLLETEAYKAAGIGGYCTLW